MYLVKPKLTMSNIEGVINMANMTFSKDIFADCEQLLENSISKDNLFRLL